MQKRVLVTGGAGFIGSHLCRRLVEEGHKVVSLDSYFCSSALNHVEGVDYRVGHTRDIVDHVSEHLDLIFHLGEYSRVEKSLTEPSSVLEMNTIGTIGVLNFWRSRGCKLVYAGSSTKFTSDGGLGRNQSPYAWTKATNTELVQNFSSWYKLPSAITYFYNVYGPGERSSPYGTLIEIFRQQYLRREKLTVVSPGTQKRNFTHVDDIVEGLLLVGEKGEGDEFGLGATESYSVLEVAEMFGGEIEMLPPRPGNRMDAALNTLRSYEIGWKPMQSLRDYILSIKQGR